MSRAGGAERRPWPRRPKPAVFWHVLAVRGPQSNFLCGRQMEEPAKGELACSEPPRWRWRAVGLDPGLFRASHKWEGKDTFRIPRSEEVGAERYVGSPARNHVKRNYLQYTSIYSYAFRNRLFENAGFDPGSVCGAAPRAASCAFRVMSGGMGAVDGTHEPWAAQIVSEQPLRGFTSIFELGRC